MSARSNALDDFGCVRLFALRFHIEQREQRAAGEQAYRRYMEHTEPFLKASGGDLLFSGRGGPFLIGPPEERWDAALLVRQRSVADFIAFAQNAGYLAGMGHRQAALEDSRLLPLSEWNVGS